MSFQVMLQQLTTGFGQTLLIFFLTLLFSLPLGMVVYFGRVSRFKPLSWIVKAYISIMRGTPLMLQLLLWYFGPFYLWGMNIGNYTFFNYQKSEALHLSFREQKNICNFLYSLGV